MLNLGAIVAFFVTIASCTGTNMATYNEENMRRFHSIYPQISRNRYTANLINPDIVVPFKARVSYDDGINLVPESLPNPERINTSSVCRNLFGISIVNQGIFCNISIFNMVTDSDHGNTIEFRLELEYYYTPPIEVTIPVFKLPSELAGATQEDLQKWATENNVGLVAPLTKQDFESIRSTNRVTLQFDWLVEHLKLGLFRCAVQYYEQCSVTAHNAYAMRPIVLPEESIIEIRSYIDLLSYDEESVSSSDLSELDGLADLNDHDL